MSLMLELKTQDLIADENPALQFPIRKAVESLQPNSYSGQLALGKKHRRRILNLKQIQGSAKTCPSVKNGTQ